MFTTPDHQSHRQQPGVPAASVHGMDSKTAGYPLPLSPLPIVAAARSVARCVLVTVQLLARRRVHLPREHVGQRLRFADGTEAVIYRETVVDHVPTSGPAVLVVTFRLRGVHSAATHALFRWESLLNTPLFLGFPGLVSKLWLASDSTGAYRGLYQWDDPQLAADYARTLWRVLALVSVPGSIRYHVIPGITRDELLSRSGYLDELSAPDWSRLASAENTAA